MEKVDQYPEFPQNWRVTMVDPFTKKTEWAGDFEKKETAETLALRVPDGKVERIN